MKGYFTQLHLSKIIPLQFALSLKLQSCFFYEPECPLQDSVIKVTNMFVFKDPQLLPKKTDNIGL